MKLKQLTLSEQIFEAENKIFTKLKRSMKARKILHALLSIIFLYFCFENHYKYHPKSRRNQIAMEERKGNKKDNERRKLHDC